MLGAVLDRRTGRLCSRGSGASWEVREAGEIYLTR